MIDYLGCGSPCMDTADGRKAYINMLRKSRGIIEGVRLTVSSCDILVLLGCKITIGGHTSFPNSVESR